MSFRHGRRVSAGLVVAIASAVAAVAVASGGQGVRAVAAKPRPDLVVRTVSASPSFVRPGAVMTIKDRVANSGNARAGRSTVGYYLTRNVPAPQIRIGGRQVGALRKHKSSSATTSARLPPTLGSASYRFMACADDSGKVRERHEANNCRAAPAPVVVDVLSPASSASAPHLTRSDSIPVAYTANGTGSPLARVELWVRTPGSGSFAKAATDTSPAASGHHFNYTAGGDGQYSFYTRAYDRAGNAERAPSPPDAETLRDTRAPSTTDDVPTSFVDHAVTVTLTAADTGGAGVDKTYYETGGSPPDPTTSSSVYDPASKPALTNGERIKYLSTDNAGNAEPVKTSQPARIDTAAPTSSATATDLTNSSSISVGYSASDSGSGLAKVELYARPPGAGQFSLAGTDTSPAASGHSFTYTANAGDGDYAFYTRAYDNVGNVEPAPAAADATTTLDTKPPALTLTQPADNATTDLMTFAGAVGTAPRDASSVSLTLSGNSTSQSPSATVTGSSWSATASPFLSAGSYTVTATQHDAAGNVATLSHSFTVPVSFLAAGDIAGDPDLGADGGATGDLIRQRAGTVATLGDNAYENGTLDEFNTWYDSQWGPFKSRTFPAPGNREYNTTGASGYFNYFEGTGTTTGPFGDRDKGYYSYDVGAWHMIALNSNTQCTTIACSASSAQETWLRSDLTAHTNQCTLAYFHHPLFSSSASTTAVRALWQALYDGGADLILSGHQHNYERFAPQKPDGTADPDHGIREFVVGTGGRSHGLFGTTFLANSEKHNDQTYGVLDLTLTATGYGWKFLPIAGQTFTDEGSGTCHGSP